jgi:glucose-6-phosphate dehydrogenase assembly protein OpcA
VDVHLSAFCNVRGGGGSQVCAEQVTIHAEGPPANHLESLAGPLLIPDLPVFLWYPGAFSPHAPEFAAMADLADRVILDSAAREDREVSLRELADMIDADNMPAMGDLQWVGLSPWRSMLADAFAAPERAGDLGEIETAEVLYAPGGECRALLLVGWLASSPDSPDARLRRVRLRSADHSFQVSRHREHREVKTTVMRGDDLVAERTVHLGRFDLGVLVGEELQFRGRDEAYEAALRAAVEALDL